MNLGLILGENSEKIKTKLVGVVDNLNIYCYKDTSSFINNATKFDIIFDRIIILSHFLRDESLLDDVYIYWDNTNRYTEVVLLCQKGKDDDLALKFLNKFCSTGVSVLSVERSSVQVMIEAVRLPISDIINKYGIADFMSVEVVEDKYYEEPKKETQQQVQKKGFLSRLFGKFDKEQQKSDTQNSTPTSDESSVSSEGTDGSQQESQPVNIDNQDSIETMETEHPQNQFQEFDEDGTESFSENSDVNESKPSLDDGGNTQEDFTFAEEEEDDFVVKSSNEDTDAKVEDDEINEMTLGEDMVITSKKPVKPEVSEVSQIRGTDDLVVGKAEMQYRKKVEQPKVRTVVKTSSILDNIKSGVSHKVIIITGDRGSGVTSLAWSLVRSFSKKVPVLFFDCDVENHGILNYIDYANFKRYEESHMKGVKLCQSSRAFNSCVCRFDTNIDLLTTDFGVEVSDKELEFAQGVVAENINNYGVVIVDCPISRLHCLTDLILTGNIGVCVEESMRGYMNFLQSIERSPLELRYKRSIVSKGALVRTKLKKKTDNKRVIKCINSFIDFDECDWLSMADTEFNGKVTGELLTKILEG